MDIKTEPELIKYEFKAKQGIVKIYFEDTTENPIFKIQGPKEIIQKAVGGKGFENQDDTETIVTENELKTEAQRLYAVLEVIKLITTK